MKVKFWGVRGSIASPGPTTVRYGGNTTCIEITTDAGETIILDAGTGIRALGNELMKQGPVSVNLVISHTHWDHIQGFPFFTPAYLPNYQLVIYGTKQGDDKIYNLLSGQMSSAYFPVDFSELQGGILSDFLGQGGRELDGVHVNY